MSFACEPDAKEALSRFLQEKRRGFHPLSGTVESVREKLKRQTRGRPSKDEEPPYRQVYRISLEIGDEEAIERSKERLGSLVLTSNVGDYIAPDILKEYKEQKRYVCPDGNLWLKIMLDFCSRVRKKS